LVSKEGPLVNERDGVLILSELAGSFEQLSEQCIPIAPTDLEGTVRALHEALNMPAEERKRRAAALKALIQDEDITFWLERQFADLMAISRQQLRAPPPVATRLPPHPRPCTPRPTAVPALFQ